MNRLGARSDLGAEDLELLGQIRELAREAEARTAALAAGLFPMNFIGSGLVSALSELCENTRTLYGLNCRYTGPERLDSENANQCEHLFRIAQEAVANAIKHGGAHSISLDLTAEAGTIVLTVSDDGCGFSEGQAKGQGLGLRIMKQRCEQIGGILEFSDNSPGTRVRCSLSQSGSGPGHES